jgi:PAS domain S-box-containing protein
MYEQLQTSNFEFRNLNNLAGLPVREGRLVIANAPGQPPDVRGTPKGHPPVKTFMGIPLYFGGELVGVAGVANRVGGYTEQIAHMLEPFVQTLAGLIDAERRAGRERQYRVSLAESERKHRLLLESAGMGIGYYDLEGRVVLFNAMACEHLDGTQDQFVGKTYFELFPHEEAIEYQRRAQSVAEFRESRVFDDHVSLPIGERWFRSTYTPVMAENTEIVGIQVISDDITPLKQMEAALCAERERLEQYLQVASVVFLVLDTGGRVVLVNRKGSEILGYGQQELVDADWFETCVPVSVREELRGIFSKIMAGDIEGQQFYENVVIDKDGRQKWIEWHNTLLRDADGHITGSLSSGQDITERRRAKEVMKTQQYYLQKAQEIGRIGTWELDIQRNVLKWTDENYRIFGVPLGTALDWERFLDFVHPEDRQYVFEKWSAGVHGEPYDIEHRITIEGKVRWVREKAEVTFDDNGEAVSAIGFTQDITDRKEAELRIVRHLEELRRWHGLTLGRETRILDLKREVNELLACSGQAPRYGSVTLADERSSS